MLAIVAKLILLVILVLASLLALALAKLLQLYPNDKVRDRTMVLFGCLLIISACTIAILYV